MALIMIPILVFKSHSIRQRRQSLGGFRADVWEQELMKILVREVEALDYKMWTKQRNGKPCWGRSWDQGDLDRFEELT